MSWTTTLDNTFIERLKKMLADRYGKGLQIRQLMDIQGLNLADDFFTKGKDLHIPIQVKGSLLGTAVVPGANDLDQENKQSLSQLVKMYLEPTMYKWYLDQRESNLVEISKAQTNLDNVRLFAEPQLPDIDDILSVHKELLNEGPAMNLVSPLVHLEGKNSTTNKKVALQLHELTGRWAFVPFHDIKGQLHSAQDIARMGAVTIFIENVETLNAAEQELISEYLFEEGSDEEPLVVTTTTQSLTQIEKSNLNANLVDEISVNCFEVDKAPLDNPALKEVLELFFSKDSDLNS